MQLQLPGIVSDTVDSAMTVIIIVKICLHIIYNKEYGSFVIVFLLLLSG